MSLRLPPASAAPPLLACLALLAAWECCRACPDINGLPPAYDALRELPAILSDREALLNIAASLSAHADRLRARPC